MLYNSNNNLVKMSEYQSALATGKKIQSPSDDPVGISKVLKYKTDLSELEQYKTNTGDALSWLETTEIALIDMSEALQRVRELTVQAASGSNSPEDLGKIRSEIEQLKNHLVSASNTSYAGRYIFSSYQTDEKLMNDDGTFNLSITNHEILNQPTTQYEIGIGDTMNISTNGLEVFGTVEMDNLLNAALPDMSTVQLQGEVDLSATYDTTKTQHMSTFDLNADHTAEDLNLRLIMENDGFVFEVDESILDGSTVALTEAEVIEAFSSPVTESGELLSDYAEIKFSAGDLVITPFMHGDDVSISGGNAVFAHQSITADIDINENYTVDHDFDISIDIGGTVRTYDVDQTAFDGTLDEAGVLAAFQSADDGSGNLLGTDADVYYNEDGYLVITSNTVAANVNTTVADSEVFDDPSNVGKGDSGDAWDVRIGDIVYDVDETALDGTLTEDEFIEVLENSVAFSPYTGVLGDAADISFDAAGNITIKAKVSGENIAISGNQNVLVKETIVEASKQETIGAKKAQMLGAFDNTGDYSVKKATQIGEIDFDGDYTADDLTITMDISGTIYTFDVDESLLDGTFTEMTKDDVLSVFKNAVDGGNTLSDFAEVEFNEDGYLIIDARTHGEDIQISGGATVFSQRSLIATLDPAVDYSATADNFDLTLTINGNPSVYTVDETLFVGGLSEDEVIEILEQSTSPTAGKLKSVADIYYDSSNNLVISAKSARPNIHLDVASSALFSAQTNVGKGLESNNLDITIDGITYDVDESMLDGSIVELENNEIAELFQSAKAYQPDTGVLSDVADVFFDNLGNMVIQSKTFGDDINITGAATLFNTTALKGSVTLTNDYTAETLDITVDGSVYDVDETLFDGSGTALTQEEIIENLGKSTDGITKLSEIADIYFNTAGDLIISVNEPDPDTEIAFDVTNTMFTGTSPVNIGRETQEIEMPIGGYINDEMVEAAIDEQSFVITLDGETKVLTLEMENYSTVDQLRDGVQNSIDVNFPPGGDVEVSITGEAGQEALVFKTLDSPDDGTVRSLDIRAVRSEKSQMMQDFDDLIEALDPEKILARQAAEEAVDLAKEAASDARVAAISGEAYLIAASEAADLAVVEAEEALALIEEDAVDSVETYITKFQNHLDNINKVRSDIGGKTNRMELVLNRIDDDNLNYTELLSNAEDADMAEIIMKLKNAENVYQASLSAGARVIQQSLVDYLR